MLYINAILYDAINDVIFEELLPISKIKITFRNKIHPNINDLDKIKFEGSITNTGDDGIILLGCL